MPADGTFAAIAPAEISAFLPASEAAEKGLHPVAAKASVSMGSGREMLQSNGAHLRGMQRLQG
jgi:hypothetical protein